MGGNSRDLPPTCVLPHKGGGREEGPPTPPRPYPGAYAPSGGEEDHRGLPVRTQKQTTESSRTPVEGGAIGGMRTT